MASRAGEEGVINMLALNEEQPVSENKAQTLPSSTANSSQLQHGSRPASFSSTIQEISFVVTITFAVSTSQILGGVLMTMTNVIGHDLHMTSAQVTWLTASESLTNGAFMLLFGRVADMFGRRPVILLSMALSTVLFIASGFISQPLVLDLFLGLIGLTSAAAGPAAMGELGAVYKEPSKRKNQAFACCSAGSGLGGALGALIGGLTLHVSTWRTGFWVLAVLSAIATLIACLTVPKDSESRIDGFSVKKFQHFDLLGALLATTGIATVTASLTLAGLAAHGWRTPYILVLLILGMLALICFVFWEDRFRTPLMPLSVWKDRNFSLLVAVLSLCFCGFAGNLLWLCLMWQRIQHNTPLLVDAKLLPAAISGICVELMVGMTMHLVGNRLFLLLGTVAFVVSNALLSASSAHITYWALMFPALILMTAGADFLFTVTNVYVLSHLPTEQQSTGSGILITMSRFAGTIGLGIQTSTFTALGGTASGPGSRLYRPYQSTFWVSLSMSTVALLLLPFITIGRQGADLETPSSDTEKIDAASR